MTNPIKATRATIQLGDIELDVFQMPSGEYRYSMTQAFISIADDGYDTKQAAKRYIEIIKAKSVQHLVGRGFNSIESISVAGDKSRVKTISQTDVSIFWLCAATLGHTKAFALLSACALESLERRADTAFNIARTEEERNDRLAARLKGKLTRRTLTDAIKDYIDRNNQLSPNYKKWIYANCSDQINTFVLGRKAKQLKSQFSIKQIREACNTKQLKELDLVEELICREIEEGGLEPLEATQFVLATKRIRQLPIA